MPGTFDFLSFTPCTSWPVLSFPLHSTQVVYILLMAYNRSSGLDFSDGKAPSTNLAEHPDLSGSYAGGDQPSHLQRNKTERRRLQGLQRTLTNSSTTKESSKPKTWRQNFDVWMINDGGRKLFFSVWIFLHLLVALFGFMTYQLRDNNTQARATFGVTFGV